MSAIPPANLSFTARAVLTDLVALAIAAVIVGLISPTPAPSGEVPVEPLKWSVALSLAMLGVAAARGDHRQPMRPELAEVLRQVFTSTAIASILLMAARVIVANDPYVAAETLRHWAVALPVLMTLRCTMLWREARARREGSRLAPTLIVGAGHVGQRVADRLLSEPEIGLRPVAFLDRAGQAKAKLPVHLFDEDLEELVRTYGVRQAIFAFAYGGDSSMPQLARRLWELDVSVKVVPRLFELGGERTVLAFLGAMPVAVVAPVNHDGWRIRVKYAIDRAVAGLALLALAPVFAAISVGVLISLGRPVLFRQLRAGNDGRRFWMLKFRTMREAPDGVEADADWARQTAGGSLPEVVTGAGNRVTRFGRLLRRSSLDELPQLLNVLRGDMSLIGPRPERVAYAEAFQHTVWRYADRHRVKSGLTGWAQVSGLRGNTSLEDRVEWDNHYIEHWSPWLDLKILLLTVPRLIRRPGV